MTKISAQGINHELKVKLDSRGERPGTKKIILSHSRASGREVIDPQTKEVKWESFIWPVESASEVNALRKSMGFKDTIEESAKSMNIDYMVLTLEEVRTAKVD